MSVPPDELRQKLTQFGQQHLLAFWEELPADERAELLREIEGLDFAELKQLHAQRAATHDWAHLAARAVAPPAVRLQEEVQGNAAARKVGEAAMARGAVGAILVAGGQGTRLGFDQPKGIYPIGPVSNASLFQILLEKILGWSRRLNTRIPLYVMTSPATHEATEAYFAENRRFGLAADDVQLLCQGTMPAVDAATGRVLLASPYQICRSPDGHGGLVEALANCGALADMGRRGIEQLFYFQVDNPLAPVCDPAFLGYHLQSGSEASTQVVAKRAPREKLGAVIELDGRVQIIEYSDLNPLDDAIVLKGIAEGAPVFWAGNTAVHVFDRALLQRAAADEQSLPFHLALKKVEHLDASGKLVQPSTENALKFERFIFDLLPSAKKSIVVEIDRDAAFAPVKNGPGAEQDSPDTVRAQIVELHRSWLQAAGAQVSPQAKVEISPLYALDAEQLRQRLQPGLSLTCDRYFG